MLGKAEIIGDFVNEQVVYADLTFLINFIMDFLILWATGKLIGIRLSYTRLVIASLLGGLYAVGYLFLDLFWYSLPMKFLFSILLVTVGLFPTNIQVFKKSILYFYSISFFVAGATMASSFLYKTNQFTFSFSYLWLGGGVLAVILLGIFGKRYLRKQLIPNLFKYKVKLNFAGSLCEGEGFLDTGNSLKDPLTNKPVLVAEYNFIKACLPNDIQAAMENTSDQEEMLNELTNSAWASRLRLIPFTSIGKRNGLLIGVRADEVIITTLKKLFIHKNIIVAIYLDRLSHEGDYQMLIPFNIIQSN